MDSDILLVLIFVIGVFFYIECIIGILCCIFCKTGCFKRVNNKKMKTGSMICAKVTDKQSDLKPDQNGFLYVYITYKRNALDVYGKHDSAQVEPKDFDSIFIGESYWFRIISMKHSGEITFKYENEFISLVDK